MRLEARHTAILIVGTGATALISIAYRIYAGRMLGPARFADFGAAVSFILLCCAALGPINGIVARFTAQYAARREHGKIRTLSRHISRRVALAGLAFFLTGLLVVTPLSSFLNIHSNATLPVACVAVVLTLLLSVARGLLRGLQRYSALSWNGVAEATSRLGMGAALLALWTTPVAGVAAFVLAAAVALMVARVQLAGSLDRHPAQPLDGSAVRRFALPMFVASLAKGGFEYFDTLAATHFLDPPELAGCYVAAANLSLVIGVLATPFATLVLPLMTSLQEQGRRTTPTFVRICLYFLILAGTPACICWLWPEWVLEVTFAEGFSQAAPWLFPLVLARLATYLAALISMLLLTRDDYRFLLIYVAAFGLEVIGLFIWHESADMIVRVVCVTQFACLMAMMAYWRWVRTTRTPPSPRS